MNPNRLYAIAKTKVQHKRLTRVLEGISTKQSELSGGAKDGAEIDKLKCHTDFSQEKRRLAHQELVLAILNHEDSGTQEQKSDAFHATTTALKQASQQEHEHQSSIDQQEITAREVRIRELTKMKNLVGDTTTLEEAQAKQLDAESKAQAIEEKADSIENHIERSLLPQEQRLKDALAEAQAKARDATEAPAVIQRALDEQTELTTEITTLD